MKFVWTPSTRRYHRTEGEVKKAKLPYEVLEIETDKDSLIDRFNAYEERIEALQQQIAGGPPPVVEQASAPSEAAPQPQVAPTPAAKLPDADEAKRRLVTMLQNMRVDEIEDKIMESKGAPFARYLLAGIARLGELGQAGWSEVRAFREFYTGDAPAISPKGKAGRINGSEERGLRLLALSLIADLDTQKPPASRGKIAHRAADSNAEAGAEAA